MLENPLKNVVLPEMSQSAPDLGLKNNDDGKDEIGKDVRQHPGNRFELTPAREIKETDNQRQAQRHLNGTRSLDEIPAPDK